MRWFEKYAVTVGGGKNHRYNLSDGILIKDNHIGAAGGVKQAIEMARAYAPFVRKIEVEVENLTMLDEAFGSWGGYYHAGQYGSGNHEAGCGTGEGPCENGMFRQCNQREAQGNRNDWGGFCILWGFDPFCSDFGFVPKKPQASGIKDKRRNHMDGEARRRRILQLLQASQKPISGGELAEESS